MREQRLGLRQKLERRLEMPERHPNPLHSFDVGIALGAGINEHGLLNPASRGVMQGLIHYLDKMTDHPHPDDRVPVVRAVFILGGCQNEFSPAKEAFQMRNMIPGISSDIMPREFPCYTDPFPTTMERYAKQARKLARRFNWRSALVFVDALQAHFAETVFSRTLADIECRHFIIPTFGSRHESPSDSRLHSPLNYLVAAYHKSQTPAHSPEP